MTNAERVACAITALSDWQANPSLSVGEIARLAGLSRTRVLQLIESGVFGRTRDRQVQVKTVLAWYAKRALALSEAGKRQCKSVPKPKAGKVLLQKSGSRLKR